MFNVLLSYQDLQNINWEAVFTAIISTVSIQSIVGYGLYMLLKRIGLKSENTEKYANDIGKSVEELVHGQKNANETLKSVKDVTVEMIKNDKEMQEIYKIASTIVDEKIKLIHELKKTVDNYIKEE